MKVIKSDEDDYINRQFAMHTLTELVQSDRRDLAIAELKRIGETAQKNMKDTINVDQPLIGIRKFYIELAATFSFTKPCDLYLTGARSYWNSSTFIAQCECVSNTMNMEQHYSTDFFAATCGVYSFKEEEFAVICRDYINWPVTAIVKNYGFILEMEHGYRSEICEITSLFIDMEKLWFAGPSKRVEKRLRYLLKEKYPNIPIYFK